MSPNSNSSGISANEAKTAAADVCFAGEENESLAALNPLDQLTDLWVFGYGSILWNTGFGYNSMEVGYIQGYARKFWQGNVTHRGTPDLPGRVATLIPQSESRVWGVAYHVVGVPMVRNCLEHLGVRECCLGGYSCQLLPFIATKSPSKDPASSSLQNINTQSSTQAPAAVTEKSSIEGGLECHLALTFVATPGSRHYLGPAGLDELARQIIACRGPSGSNVEYVVRLAEYVRANIPEDHDDHLFGLEQKIKELLNPSNSRLEGCDGKQDHLPNSTVRQTAISV